MGGGSLPIIAGRRICRVGLSTYLVNISAKFLAPQHLLNGENTFLDIISYPIVFSVKVFDPSFEVIFDHIHCDGAVKEYVWWYL